MGTGNSGGDGECSVQEGHDGGGIDKRMAAMVVAVVTVLLMVMIYDDAENGGDGECRVDDGDGGGGTDSEVQ